MSLEEIFLKCIRCKKVVEWKEEERTFSNGTIHIQGTCKECGYTKWLPQHKELSEHKFFFGKHKGKNITEVPLEYLQWALEKDVIGGGLALASIEYLKSKGIEVKNYRNV